MDKYNHKDKGTEGPGKKWNPGSVGGYSRGLQAPKTGKVEDHNRKGPGQK
jgi:hypothetical protein